MALSGICRGSQILRILQFSKSLVGILNDGNLQKMSDVRTLNFVRHENFCTIKNPLNPRDIGKPVDPNAPRRHQPEKKRKPLTSPHITLLDPNDSLSVMTLEQAEKLAKSKDFMLVKIVDFDTRTERPVYKLMTKQQLFEEEIKAKELKKEKKNSDVKDVKMFNISTKIDKNDLQIKMKQIAKALQKRHEICLFINPDGNPHKVDGLSTAITESLKEVASVDNVAKKSHGNLKMKFYPKSAKERMKGESNKAASEKNPTRENDCIDSSSERRGKKIKLEEKKTESNQPQ
ncbi:hypothetical protein QAD02_011037 [Eretmocerus hayati]|uniref:Uncharacterized protein n=1 Tax=Eretmocerus hayati TaxID=131215 RepID=A0ACC2NXC9_9HYME|nr:hypothetical protein QAD02_011037 [Eretmocerus hayati]